MVESCKCCRCPCNDCCMSRRVVCWSWLRWLQRLLTRVVVAPKLLTDIFGTAIASGLCAISSGCRRVACQQGVTASWEMGCKHTRHHPAAAEGSRALPCCLAAPLQPGFVQEVMRHNQRQQLQQQHALADGGDAGPAVSCMIVHCL